jgi:hypothetical protein
LLLDLSRFYDFAPDSVRNPYYNIVPAMRPMPVGVQRIGGVDYDLRGMVQLGDNKEDATRSKSIHCLALPPGPLAALRPLLMVSWGSPASTGTVAARVTLHYADGGTAQIPIRAGQEVPGYAGNDLGVPLVFDGAITLFAMGLDAQGDTLSAPRLVNPQPERPVRCVDVDSDTTVEVVMGMTAEPAGPTTGNGSAVIRQAVSRTNMQQGAASTSTTATSAPTPARRSP